MQFHAVDVGINDEFHKAGVAFRSDPYRCDDQIGIGIIGVVLFQLSGKHAFADNIRHQQKRLYFSRMDSMCNRRRYGFPLQRNLESQRRRNCTGTVLCIIFIDIAYQRTRFFKMRNLMLFHFRNWFFIQKAVDGTLFVGRERAIQFGLNIRIDREPHSSFPVRPVRPVRHVRAPPEGIGARIRRRHLAAPAHGAGGPGEHRFDLAVCVSQVFQPRHPAQQHLDLLEELPPPRRT